MCSGPERVELSSHKSKHRRLQQAGQLGRWVENKGLHAGAQICPYYLSFMHWYNFPHMRPGRSESVLNGPRGAYSAFGSSISKTYSVNLSPSALGFNKTSTYRIRNGICKVQ